MMRWWRPMLLLVLALGAGWLIWTWLFPPPEKVIRRRLAEVAQFASFSAKEGDLAKLSNAQKLASYLTSSPEIVVHGPGQSRYRFSSQDEVFHAAMGARQALFSLKLEFLDVTVKVADIGTEAVVTCTATGRIGGERELLVQELKMTWQNVGGKWLIHRIETVKVLT